MDSLRVLHTSDWHLGRKLYKKDRTDEGEFFLTWLLAKVEEFSVDVLIVAGDIFDVYNPPHHSIQVFYKFLIKIQKTKTKVVIISGNHDSQTLIDTGNIILDKNQFFFKTRLDSDFQKNIITLNLKQRVLHLKTLPYFRNFELYQFNKDNGVDNIEDTTCIENYLKDHSYAKENDIDIFVGHHGFGEFAGSGSEQAISLSGLSSIPLAWIDGHDFCALGHIHKYQNLKKDQTINYCGSPYQMRFSESAKKYVNLIEFTSDKTPHIQKIQIDLARELIQIKTNLQDYKEDIKKRLSLQKHTQTPFVEVLIKMDKASHNLADEVRLLCQENNGQLLSFSPVFTLNESENKEAISLKKLNMVEMLGEFHKQKFNEQEISSHLLDKFNLLMDAIDHENQ